MTTRRPRSSERTTFSPASILALGSFILKYYVIKMWKKCTGLIVKKRTKAAEGEVEQSTGPNSLDVEAPAPPASTKGRNSISLSVDSVGPPARRPNGAESRPRVPTRDQEKVDKRDKGVASLEGAETPPLGSTI